MQDIFLTEYWNIWAKKFTEQAKHLILPTTIQKRKYFFITKYNSLNYNCQLMTIINSLNRYKQLDIDKEL